MDARGPASAERLVVLFDRDCGLCQWTVRKLQRLDRGVHLDLVALQDAPEASDPVVRDVAREHALERALHVVHRDGRVAVGGAAVLAILEVLPGGTLIRAWRDIPGSRALAGIAYSLVAGHRDAIGRIIRRDDHGAVVCEVERTTRVI
jgi:predicted DCC family thiol-disulfide oxidoreductase YuxK